MTASDQSGSEEAELLEAGRVSLGALGVLTEITLQCRASYGLVEGGGRIPLKQLLADEDRLLNAYRHFEFFWFPCADEVLVKTLDETQAQAGRKDRQPDGADSPDDKNLRRLCEVSRYMPFMRGPFQRFATRVAGGRYSGSAQGDAYWSFDAFPSERNVRFNEMEYAVPAEHALDCLQEVAEAMRQRGGNFMFPLEYRHVAADEGWLSPFHGRDSVTISIHQYHRQPFERLFDAAEAVFRRYQGRPHWGKLHTLGADELAKLYPKWDDFLALRQRLDPQGKFLNPYLRGIFGL